MCLSTFDFDFSLFFSRSNKKEKDTLPNFRLLDELDLPGSFPSHCVLILACYKLVVSLWIPDNKDQIASILICWYCKLLLIKIKVLSNRLFHHPPWGDLCPCFFFAFLSFFLQTTVVIIYRVVYFDLLSIPYSISKVSK